MSLVFAVLDRDKHTGYLAADSAAESSQFPEVELFKDPKQSKLNAAMAVGGVGSYRTFQVLLEAAARRPNSPLLQENKDYVSGVLLPEFRAILAEAEQTVLAQEEGAEFLGIINGDIVEIDHTWHILHHMQPYAAIGSGAPYAKAAWLALSDNTTMTTQAKIDKVFAIVEILTYTVRNPHTTSTVVLP